MRRLYLSSLILFVILPVSAILSNVATARAEVPAEAQQYRRDLTRIAQAEWGLDAPVATFAAQVHQESRWRFNAKSPVGAQGLGQVMPSTAVWLAELFPDTLGNVEPYNPTWSLMALVSYDRWLADRIKGRNACERHAMVLSSYNGGLGWLIRDRKLASANGADPLAWFGSIERFNAGRSVAAFRENRGYPRLILKTFEAQYIASGWGEGVCS
ncbi:membrane-bound lytic transglycosylase F [Pseudomonas putida]|nr:membrane-bound lytic transglycosylase F [Pseudomonas putida]CAB5660950.1 membrane-bound lytic transglycosylase F [Pseudomonas putida]CAB5686823.1 membrane-bound lytic transglycosylase F [Pseudomonas putida]CAB5699560.1 membrane-bound lytic transglycosylase F [Pseudomonas putida]CAC9680931.1 membrane-bound lytic transglycosylase F [Pseudomonas putida]